MAVNSRIRKPKLLSQRANLCLFNPCSIAAVVAAAVVCALVLMHQVETTLQLYISPQTARTEDRSYACVECAFVVTVCVRLYSCVSMLVLRTAQENEGTHMHKGIFCVCTLFKCTCVFVRVYDITDARDAIVG
jgi:hypothetical protein